MKEVSKEQFDEFIKQYPQLLEKDFCSTSEPALISYNDCTLGNWPKSMVAKTFNEANAKYFIRD